MLPLERELRVGQPPAGERGEALRAQRARTRRAARASDLPSLSRNCANRSNGSNGRLRPCSRMIRARGIQSVRSPWIRWPTTSNALHVSGPFVRVGPRRGRSGRAARAMSPACARARGWRRGDRIPRRPQARLDRVVHDANITPSETGQRQRSLAESHAPRLQLLPVRSVSDSYSSGRRARSHRRPDDVGSSDASRSATTMRRRARASRR